MEAKNPIGSWKTAAAGRWGWREAPSEATAEFLAVEQFLAHLPWCLKPGARVAIVMFHSGEERRASPRSSSERLRWVVKKTAQD